MAHPTLFIPSLVNILPSVLTNLSSTSGVIRIAATHALGGFAYALISSEELFGEDQFIEIHSCASKMVYDYFVGTKVESPRTSPSKKTETGNETWIVRTLRTVGVLTDPPSSASSPIWAVCILSSITILLGPVLLKDWKALRLLSSLLQPLLRHKKGSVRALAYRVVSMLTLGWIKYAKGNADDQEDLSELAETKVVKNCREMYWKVICSSLDGGNAVGADRSGGVYLDPDKDRSVLIGGQPHIHHLPHRQAAEAHVGGVAEARNRGKPDVVIVELAVQLNLREP